MVPDYKKLIFSINDDSDQRIYENQNFLNLLENIQILNDNEILISIDEYHSYCNDDKYFYGYDKDGGVYKIKRDKVFAELIDVCTTIKNKGE